MDPTARASLLWRVGACQGRRSSASRRSATFAISAARIGAAGSASKTVALCQQRRFASTPTPSRARRRNGSRSTRTDRCSRLLVYGPLGAVFEGRRARQWMGSMSCSAFLTTEANAVVAPIHPKAMPVILTTQAEIDLWLLADAPKALELQRPLPDHALRASRAEKRRMVRARLPCPTGIKTKCFRFEAPRRFQP
jgi:hypothetical protein